MAFIINGERIGDDVIGEEFEGIKDHFQNLGEVVCCDRDEEFMEVARNNVINRTLLLQESLKKFGDPSEAEVDGMIHRLKEEHGGEDQFYANTGYSPADEFKIRSRVSNTISVDRIFEEAIGPDPAPSNDELEEYYQENIERYLTEEEVRVAQVFKEPNSQEAAKEAFQLLRKTRERLLDGEDFFEVAREVGDKEENEVDLGFFKLGDTMPEIEAMTFSMRDQEISPVVATHYGFHIFKVTERKKPEPIPFDDLQDQVREQYLGDHRQRRMDELVESLKSKGSIEEVEEAVEPV